MSKIINVDMSVGDMENLRPAKILFIKMQFIELVMKGTNWLVDGVHDEIYWINVLFSEKESLTCDSVGTYLKLQELYATTLQWI